MTQRAVPPHRYSRGGRLHIDSAGSYADRSLRWLPGEHCIVRTLTPVPNLMPQWLPCLLVLLIAAVLSGCAAVGSGEPYRRPDLPEKETWSQLESRELMPSDVIHPQWWSAFGDPYLNELVESAVSGNTTLSQAALRLQQAGIDLNNERRNLVPDITGNPSTRVGGGSEISGATVDNELVGLNVSWEIDIWGKVRKGLAAQQAGYAATEMDWRATYLKLVADVASRYFLIRQFDEQIAQQEEALATSKDLLSIYEMQYQEGLVAKTQVLNQRSEFQRIGTDVMESRRARQENELKLARLLGKAPGEFEVPVASLRDHVQTIEVPLVLPGEVLAQRPDVLKAEYSVLRAHHLLGKARLSRLPTLNLSAGLNMASLAATSWTWGITGSFARLFDHDTEVQIQSSEIAVRDAELQYRESVLTAYEEVEIAMLNLRSRKLQMESLEDQIANLTVVRDVQRERLKEGLVSQLELFETERSLLSSQQAILQAYQQVLSDTVTLYMALGGGWSEGEAGDRKLAAGG